MSIETQLPTPPSIPRGRWVPFSTLAVVASVALLSACGSSKSSSTSTTVSLDTARVARSIEESIRSQRHLKSTVVCPAKVAQEKGRTFECVATIPNTKRNTVTKTTFVVTIHNDKGYVTYEGK